MLILVIRNLNNGNTYLTFFLLTRCYLFFALKNIRNKIASTQIKISMKTLDFLVAEVGGNIVFNKCAIHFPPFFLKLPFLVPPFLPKNAKEVLRNYSSLVKLN